MKSSDQLINILIVDDSEEDRNLYQIYLGKKEGQYKFIEAGNLESAGPLMKDNQIDLFIIDYFLSDGTGINLLKTIRAKEKYSFTPLLFITGQGDELVAVDAIKNGAQEYIIKDTINKSNFPKIIENVIEKQALKQRIKIQEHEKEEFLGLVAHDLKNPLSIVKTALEIACTSIEKREYKAAISYIKSSIKGADIALEIITNLLDQARIEGEVVLDYDLFHADQLIHDCIDALKFKVADKRVKIIADFDGEFELYADYGRMAQIINNILSNAVKYVPENGKIEILLSHLKVEDDKDGKQDCIKISIKDNGLGIPAEQLKTIFYKFQQVSKTDRAIGTGLGLSIARKLCELHGGNIWVESTLGKGAIFNIVLPVGKNKIKQKRSDVNILYVEDDNECRIMTQKQLASAGYNICTVASGREALLMLHNVDFDLILLDLYMASPNGYDILEEIKKNSENNISIIVYSVEEDKGKILNLVDAIDDYIQKPASQEELESRIDSAVSITSRRKLGVYDAIKTILIVDDESNIRKILSNIVNHLGYEVICAKNGLEGLFLLNKYGANAIFTDIKMPNIDGYYFIELIRQKHGDIPIVIVSGLDKGEIEKKLSNYSSIKVLQKPIRLQDIYKSVEYISNIKKHKKIIDNVKILVVDDSEEYCFLIRKILNDYFSDLEIATSGEDAIKKHKNNKFDIILMDVTMPEMSGFEACKKIREFDKLTPVIAVTAHSKQEKQQEAIDHGLTDFIQKPITYEKVDVLVKKYF